MAGPVKGNVLTGARVSLVLDGLKVYYCTNVSYSEEVEQFPVEVLDQFDVAEHVALAYRVTFSAQMVRLVNQPIKNRGGIKIFPRFESILDMPEMTGDIMDRKSATPLSIATIHGVKATRYNTNIATRAGVFHDVEFVARRIIDESEIA